MNGYMHPSLKAYIDCFTNPVMTKAWPRSGGLWDQDPMLVKDFRFIGTFEREWKGAQDAMHGNAGGGDGPLGSMLDQYVAKIQEEEGM